MTTTPNKGYTLPTVGADFGVWANELNSDLSIIDLNFGGNVTVNCAGNSNITVNATQAQNLAQTLTGALTGNILYILPQVGAFYIINNRTTGSFTITAITSAGGSTGIAVPQGGNQLVWSDGVNVYSGAPPTNLGVPTWRDVTSSRSLGTIFTNITGLTIFISVSIQDTGGGGIFVISAAGTAVVTTGFQSGAIICPVVPIPAGATYQARVATGSATLLVWQEFY